MSRYTWLKTGDVAAIAGCNRYHARLMLMKLDAVVWRSQQARCTAGQLLDYLKRMRQPTPPLLVALVADEREYPAWLTDLRREWSASARRFRALKKKPARTERAETSEQFVQIVESLPELEARGYLDDGLPPEWRMEDKWKLAGGDDDG